MEPVASLSKVRRDIRHASAAIAAGVALALCWAVFAPVAVTIRVNGEISSSQPSHPVQHPNGGRIETVVADLYDRVETGDLILTFDTREQELRQKALSERAEFLRAELHEINARLSDGLKLRPLDYSTVTNAVSRLFEQRETVLAAQLASGTSKINAASARRVLLKRELSAQEKLRDQIRGRIRKSEELAAKGLLAQIRVENMRESLMEVDVDIYGSMSEIEQLTSDIATTGKQNELAEARYEQTLSESRLANQRELIEIEAELARVEHLLAKSEVRATASGMITSLDYKTPDMVAPPGATLAVISQPILEPKIELRIPAAHIDQVFPGQSGKLTVTSLAQRDAPEISVTLVSIAEEPVETREDMPAFYSAKASISPADLETARATLADRFQLVLGMPVTVALAADEITFWKYVSGPLAGVWSTAFQE